MLSLKQGYKTKKFKYPKNCINCKVINKLKVFKAIEIALVFMLGFLSAYFINYSTMLAGVENPLSFISYGSKNAPTDYLSSENIEFKEDKIIIHIPNATMSLSKYADTGSMLPVLNENTNGIKIVPKTESEINVGDIITFERDDFLIVHRVIKKGTDSHGTYFITKGDNNLFSDGKIRFKDILYKTIVLVY